MRTGGVATHGVGRRLRATQSKVRSSVKRPRIKVIAGTPRRTLKRCLRPNVVLPSRCSASVIRPSCVRSKATSFWREKKHSRQKETLASVHSSRFRPSYRLLGLQAPWPYVHQHHGQKAPWQAQTCPSLMFTVGGKRKTGAASPTKKSSGVPRRASKTRGSAQPPPGSCLQAKAAVEQGGAEHQLCWHETFDPLAWWLWGQRGSEQGLPARRLHSQLPAVQWHGDVPPLQLAAAEAAAGEGGIWKFLPRWREDYVEKEEFGKSR